MRSLGVLLAGLALSVAACGPSATPSAPARVYDVQVDSRATSFSLAAGLYFPREVQAHAGDTIRFRAIDRGEIHTVTFGTLVDAALGTIASTRGGAAQPTLEALGLPPVFIGEPPAVELGQSAVQPCFLKSGVPPAGQRCAPEQQVQPEFTGTYSIFNSGYLPADAVFAVRLSESVKPGTYDFLCLLHGPDMRGRIVVVDKARPVPTPAEVTARGLDEFAEIVGGLETALRSAGTVPQATVTAGVNAPNARYTQATEFVPKEVSVRVGDAVTWNVDGVHTISFNMPQDAVGSVIRASDGSWTLNQTLFAPVRSQSRPGGPTGGPPIRDSGAWDGKGSRSSGAVCSGTTPPAAKCADRAATVAYRVTFSQPGTYSYKCLLHTDMEGLVKVGDR